MSLVKNTGDTEKRNKISNRIRRCKKCIVPSNFPHVTFDKEGVCSLCRDFAGKKEINRLRKEYRNKFNGLVKRYNSKSEYDILLCYSGGKDSTYTLSILKNVYKLKILAFTLDNGFVPPETFNNIRNVVEKLCVDHICFKPRFDLLSKIFKRAAKTSLYPPKTLERASAICTSCAGLVKYISLKVAVEKEIPFIGFGWSPGQAPVTSSILQINPAMIKSMENVLKGPMSKIIGASVEAYFLNKRHYAKQDKFPIFIHPLAFFIYDEQKILNAIKEFGWRRPYGVELNATNCYLNPFADEVHIAQYHFHPYVSEIASLVRGGYMTRKDGLRHILFRKSQKAIKKVEERLKIKKIKR